jgi:hypothetical protein
MENRNRSHRLRMISSPLVPVRRPSAGKSQPSDLAANSIYTTQADSISYLKNQRMEELLAWDIAWAMMRQSHDEAEKDCHQGQIDCPNKKAKD